MDEHVMDQMKSESRSRMTSVLIVDDEPGICGFLQRGLQKYFDLVEIAENMVAAEALHERCYFDLVIADIQPSERVGIEWVTKLREQGVATGVIFMAACADPETTIAALRAGAEDFIMKPFRMEQMMASVKRYMDRQRPQRQNLVLQQGVDPIFDGSGIVGECELIRTLCKVIKRVAPMPSTVLIEGESGTGKELAARAIHQWSGRSGSFVPVNCGAMSAELLESELFGHIKGAFTGAHQAREGLFNYANEGTLFLDEIGEMPLSMQAHLLRVLEERTVRPVGSDKEVPVAVRIIAATNQDLGELVQGGTFREDLFYRLNVLSLRMPSLRERQEDIPILTTYFCESLASDLGVEPPRFSHADLACLRSYTWPGNVRELKNVIERCLLLSNRPSQCLTRPTLPAEKDATEGISDDLQLESVEKRHILRVLKSEGGNKSAAARLLGISRKTLERKVQTWEMNG